MSNLILLWLALTMWLYVLWLYVKQTLRKRFDEKTRCLKCPKKWLCAERIDNCLPTLCELMEKEIYEYRKNIKTKK